jgi:hypothetical protein
MSKCTQNPWMNQSTDCIVLEKKLPYYLVYNGSVPISAAAMSGGQKQALLSSYMTIVTAYNVAASQKPSGSPLQILSPQFGGKYNGDITVQVKLRADYLNKVNKINLNWTYVPNNKPPVFLNILPELTVQNGEAKTVLPRAKFEQNPGYWNLVAEAQADGGKFSDKVEFTVLPSVPAIHIKK